MAYELKQDGYPINKLPLTVKEAVDTMQNLIKGKAPHGSRGGLNKVPEVLYSEGLVEESEAKTDPSEAIITIKGLNHIYMQGSTFEHKALKDIDLTINKGEVLGIIGQTGSGKSTLVQHFNGIFKALIRTLEVAGLKTEGKHLRS